MAIEGRETENSSRRRRESDFIKISDQRRANACTFASAPLQDCERRQSERRLLNRDQEASPHRTPNSPTELESRDGANCTPLNPSLAKFLSSQFKLRDSLVVSFAIILIDNIHDAMLLG